MGQLWLALDVNFLCHRSFNAMGGLSYQGEPTGVLYGFLRDLNTLQDRFATRRLIFCFDKGKLKREEIYPQYKHSRRVKKLSGDEVFVLDGLQEQIQRLRTSYLPQIGYKNIFSQEGYEADDIIASVVNNTDKLPPTDRIIMVTADKDMYQLLGKRVAQWNPNLKTLVTAKTFRQKYGLSPRLWSYVKAIAGCTSDDIYGVDGVGEKTACKFLTKQLPPNNKKAMAIRSTFKHWVKNLKLVRLPFDGCKPFVPAEDERDEEGWRTLCSSLGFASFEGGSQGTRIALNREPLGVF